VLFGVSDEKVNAGALGLYIDNHNNNRYGGVDIA
jgi:hypothetical protein